MKAIDKAIRICKKKTRTKDAPKKNWIIIKRMKRPAGKDRYSPDLYVEYVTTNEPNKMRTQKININNYKEFKDRKDIKWDEIYSKSYLQSWASTIKNKEWWQGANNRAKKEDTIWATMGEPNVGIRNKHGSFVVYKNDKPIFLTGSESDAYKKYYRTAIDMIKEELKKDPNSRKSQYYMNLHAWESKFKEIRDYYKQLTGKDYFDKNKG